MKKYWFGAVLAASGLAFVLWQWPVWLAPEHLHTAWEGAVIDTNFRDIGASLNACLGEDKFKPGVALRANGWFSGWSCAAVGKPDVILELNYQPAKGERSFCRDGNQLVVGQKFNDDVVLADLEFLASWQQPAMKTAACAFFRAGLQALAANERVLFHCDAGRDRTGTYAAVLTAVAAEESGQLDARMLAAIECDYRKTASLSPQKFGRMQRFITDLQARGGVRQFLQTTCGVEPSVFAALTKVWVQAAH